LGAQAAHVPAQSSAGPSGDTALGTVNCRRSGSFAEVISCLLRIDSSSPSPASRAISKSILDWPEQTQISPTTTL